MDIKPLFDRVIVEDFETKKETASGLFIPPTAQEHPNFAKIVAVGEGGFVEGKKTVIQVKPGDNVIYSQFAGVEYKFKNKVYKIIRQADILAIIKENVLWVSNF